MLRKQYNSRLRNTLILCMAGITAPATVMAADAAATGNATPPIDTYQLMRYILLGFAVLFMFIILVMANAVGSAGKIYWEREKEKEARRKNNPVIPMILLLLLSGTALHAQDTEAVAAVKTPHMPYDLYLFIVVVALEFVIIMVLSVMLLRFLKVRTEAEMNKTTRAFSMATIFRKMNQTVAIEDEAQLDLQHDYDGIRELDNKVPAWWQYAFYASILFGVVYIYRMFVAGTLPDQIQELSTANRIAAVRQAEYLKNAANNVDEKTVTMMDAAGIAEGAALFSKNCLACHGDKGQGGVGPNLTDNYWLHNGGIKDIFHSIKYGWPEKGMKSWKDDFSPVQIAQLASYVKSLDGTNVPGGKEPQGTVYTEAAATAPATDSVKTQL